MSNQGEEKRQKFLRFWQKRGTQDTVEWGLKEGERLKEITKGNTRGNETTRESTTKEFQDRTRQKNKLCKGNR